MAQVATEATQTAVRVVELRERDRARVSGEFGRRAGNALRLLDQLFRNPVVNAKSVERLLEVSQPTASSLLGDFARVGLLRELTGRRRYRLFAYSEYLDLFPGADRRD